MKSIPHLDHKEADNWTESRVLLGEYVVEKEIGHGGMGRVWLAKSNSTGRRYAVKQTRLKGEKSRKAFLAELQTWIDLPEHPNIVPCRFFRTVGDEIVIFTDYIEGGSLKDWIAQGKLTALEQILDVAIQFAWGLHAIHERGMIHQDVKPENVLMLADGRPLVADFGLTRARQVAPDGEYVSPTQLFGSHSILVPGAGVMTKQYASPEQKTGQPLSRKTDIWSWGVSLLDIFMGGVSCPHGGHIAAEVLAAFLYNGGQVAGLPKMPEQLAEILSKCFARDPAARLENLNAAVTATKNVFQKATGRAYLKQVQQDRATPAIIVRHDYQELRGAKWSNPLDLLRKAYVANGRDPSEADNYQVPATYSRKGAAVADLAIFEEAERQYRSALACWNARIADELATLYDQKARVLWGLDDVAGGLAAVDLSIAIWRQLVGQEGPWFSAAYLALALMNKAVALRRMGDPVGAKWANDESIAIYRRLVEQDGRRELAEYLAKALLDKGNAPDPCDLFMPQELSESITIYRQLVEQEGRQELANDLAAAQFSQANALERFGNLADSVKLFDESIAIRRRLVEQEGRRELANDLAVALLDKAVVLRRMGDLAGAEEVNDESIAIYRQLVEQDGRRDLAEYLAKAIRNKAGSLRRIGNLADAGKARDESVATFRRLVEDEGRRDLLGDLYIAQLGCLHEKLKTGSITEDDCRQARKVYRTLSIEVRRTRRSDLRDAMLWAQEALRGVL